MNLKGMLIGAAAVLALFLLWNSVYIVMETERAILLRFGEVVRADVEPGLGVKLPIADEVKKFNAKVLTVDAPVELYFTLEQKPLMVDSFAKWRIGNVSRYYTSTSGSERLARSLLQERVNEGLRNQISRRNMHEVVSGERDQLMAELATSLDAVMTEEMGVRVVDVRVKRIDLPAEVEASVFERMNTARQIEAQQYRASGKEQGIGIRADADRQVTVIKAEAYRRAEEIRGGGDAEATKAYAEAYNKDQEFYAFYRRVTAYSKVFASKDDLLVLDPESDFFRYLKSGER